MRYAPIGLLLAAAILAVLLLAPYRSVPLTRADGVTVRLLDPDRLDHTSDAWDYLQLGRQIASGRGLTSRFTYVPFLPESVADGDPVDAFPLFWRQPGFPFLVAAALTLSGTGEPNGYLWLLGIGILLLPLAVYRLARTVTTPGWACLAGLWSLGCPAVLGGSDPLVATTWFAIMVAVLFRAVLVARGSAGAIVTGLLLGGVALFRMETWILLPGLGLVGWLSGRLRPRELGLLLAAAVAMVLPWHLRLFDLTGSPLFNAGSLLFHDTPPFPGWDASRSLAVRDLGVFTFLAAHGEAVARKTVLDLARFGRDLVLLPSPVLAVCFWAGLLWRPAERDARALILGGAGGLAVLVLVLAPLEYAARFLAPMAPVLVVGAAVVLAGLPRYRRILAGAATLVAVVATVLFLAVRPPVGTARLAAEDLVRLMARPEAAPLERTAVALADSPTLYAWIWDRPAVWAPVAASVEPVRTYLPGSIALFTRAGGIGDSLDPEIVSAYAAAGARVIGTERPQLLLWPPSPDSVRVGASKEGR